MAVAPPPPPASPASAPAQPARSVRRVRTPTVLQLEAVECGAAALAIVLGYHGRYVPLEELRAVCGVSRDGSKASNVVRAGRSYGLVSKGYRLDPKDLPGITLPFIVFWEFNHFLVVEGFSRHRVYLNDPAFGPRTVTHEEFNQAFTGVVLTFDPGPDFQRGGTKPNPIVGLARRLKGSEGDLLYCVVAGLALVVPGLAIPIFSKIFVDEILIRGLRSWLAPLLLGLAITAGLRAALTWVQQYYLLRLNTKLAITMSGTFLWSVLRLPMDFYTQRYAGDIGWRVALNDTVARQLSGQLATSFLNAITVVFYAVLMFYFDAVLTLLGIFFVALTVVALGAVSRRRSDLNQRLLQEEGKLLGTAMAGLQGIDDIKATGSEADFFARWSGAQAKVVVARQELGVPTQYLTAVPPFLALLNLAAILGIGGLRIMQGDITIGTLVAFQILMLSFIQPFTDLVNLGSRLQQAAGGINKLDDVPRYPSAEFASRDQDPESEATGRPLDAGRGTGPAPKLAGQLELRNVSFGYSPLDSPLIKDFSLLVQPGQRVALVGESGGGKSTVSRLVSGLSDPWSGEILFDGLPRSTIPREILANAFSLVGQDIFLFEGTVAENLSLWDATIPPEQIVRAAKDACIHEVIAARPGGYESRVEEGGRNFSGGQAQRLAIARALATNPSLIVLDEATASLDPLTERRIDLNLRRRGCTCLIIAHRLSTIRDCDEIIVLDRGKVVQRGAPEELQAADGAYARLIAD